MKKQITPPTLLTGSLVVLALVGVIAWLLLRNGPEETDAATRALYAPEPAATADSAPADPAPQAADSDSPLQDETRPPAEDDPPPEPAIDAEPEEEPSPPAPSGVPEAAGEAHREDDGRILLSFERANIDTVVQWLAKTSGKSVVKHPRVQCQLTIVSSNKLTKREALNIVYRSLALEGFATIESSNAILIVPEGQEPAMSPELLGSGRPEIPEGRQRFIKAFPVTHISAADVEDLIGGVLSEDATIDADERGRRIVVTDFNDNLRLLEELLAELDTASPADTAIEIFTLNHADAEELADLLSVVLNERTASRGASGASEGAGATAGGQTVRLWPDGSANRLIVTAPRSRLSEIQELIETLDSEKPGDVAIRVLPLRHASAEDVAASIAPLYQRMSGRSLKDMIEVTANSRSNALLVLSNESNFRGIEKLVAEMDTDDAQEQMLRAFPLTNADAEDVAEQLRELHEPQQQQRQPYYYILSSRQQPSTGGTNFVSDRRRNTVIVQAPPGAMPAIAEMIEALDEPVTDQGLAPKIFPLQYVSATDIEDVLNELFLRQEQQRGYWDYYYGGQDSSDRDVGRLYGKVRITSEPYSNSLIVTANSLESLRAIEDVVKQLDVRSQAGETTMRIELNFADATTIASNLNVLFARGGSPPLSPNPQQGGQGNGQQQQQQQSAAPSSGFELERQVEDDAYFSWLGGQPETYGPNQNAPRPVSDLVGRVRVVPDRRTNSLLLTSNVHFFPQIINLVGELDVPTAQVLIEAKIIEVSSDFRDRLGTRWSPDGERVFEQDDFDGSFMPSASAFYEEIFTGEAGGLRTGVLEAGMNLDVLVQFLRRNTDAAVLAEPQISVSDNELGKLFVGAQVPFISQSLNTPEGARSDSFQYRDVGVILEVTPHINNNDEVALRIRAESSSIRNTETLFGAAILDTRNFRTDVLIKSEQTLVLGGIIQSMETDTIRKVPILGDIPILGWAFKKRDQSTREVELIVLLRPVIIRTPEEVRAIADDLQNRSPRLRQWRENYDAEREREREAFQNENGAEGSD